MKEAAAEIAQTAPVPKATPAVTNAPAAETATPIKANDYHTHNENELEPYPTTPNSKKRKADSELATGTLTQRRRGNVACYPPLPMPQKERPITRLEDNFMSELFDFDDYCGEARTD